MFAAVMNKMWQVSLCYVFFYFFFQAEDGIRDLTVTGVQTCFFSSRRRHTRFDCDWSSTCALPIFHHLLLFLILPSSVFNYEASVWAVAVHALFVVLESIAACFVARSFFDNVIGLERIVGARTRELDARNGDLHLLLDSVGQGFFTFDRDGAISKERSAVATRWRGPAR